MRLKVYVRGDVALEAAGERILDTYEEALTFALLLHSGGLARILEARPDQIEATWYGDSGRPLGRILPSDSPEGGLVYEIVPPLCVGDANLLHYTLRVQQPELGALLIWTTKPL